MVTRQELEGQWNRVKGQVQERWGQLTDDELMRARGSASELVGVIEEKTGESRRAIEDFLEQTVAGGASAFEQTAEAARQYADQAMEMSRQQMAAMGATLRGSYGQAEDQIRRHPAESVAVAFGAGIIAGVILGLVSRSR